MAILTDLPKTTKHSPWATGGIFCRALWKGIRSAFREAIREATPERQAELREMREIAGNDPFKLAIIESGMRSNNSLGGMRVSSLP